MRPIAGCKGLGFGVQGQCLESGRLGRLLGGSREGLQCAALDMAVKTSFVGDADESGGSKGPRDGERMRASVRKFCAFETKRGTFDVMAKAGGVQALREEGQSTD